MKILASTTGNFMLRSTYTGQEIPFNRICLISSCGFVQSKIAGGFVKMHASDIPDTATDADWVKWLEESEGNEELAIASFISQFQPKDEHPEE